jgi:hypothetical protein
MVKYVKDFEFSSAGPKLVRGYMRGGSCGYAKGGATKAPVGAVKIGVVMKEFGKGKLHSGSDKGPLVKSPKQAVAIALSEARKAGAKIPVKKQAGGLMAKPGMGAMTDAERRMARAMPEAERAAGLSPKGMGAMTDAEAKRAAGRSTSYLSPKGKAALAKAPTRAQFDAMIAAQTAAPVITKAQRRAINNETMIGRKKGGMVKC